jgi:hypothetical protein
MYKETTNQIIEDTRLLTRNEETEIRLLTRSQQKALDLINELEEGNHVVCARNITIYGNRRTVNPSISDRKPNPAGRFAELERKGFIKQTGRLYDPQSGRNVRTYQTI